MDSPLSKPVTLLVTRRISPDRFSEFQSWMRRGILLAAGFPGFLGAGTLAPAPGGDEYQIMFRFQDAQSLKAWEKSLPRRMWLERGEALVRSTEIMRVDSVESVFGQREAQPPRWKRACAIWLALFPLSLLLNTIMQGPLVGAPLPLRLLLMTLLQVPVMVYLAMPAVHRVLQRWLYANVRRLPAVSRQ